MFSETGTVGAAIVAPVSFVLGTGFGLAISSRFRIVSRRDYDRWSKAEGERIRVRGGPRP